MQNLRADLHVHTYYSDGLQSPADVAAIAKSNGVRIIAVTDHDCMPAFGDFHLNCAERGIKAVRGIEVSAYSGDVKIHTLGYNMDERRPGFRKFIKELYDGSFERAADIIKKLNSHGVSITLDEVAATRKSALSPIHSMHIARACTAKGYAANAFTFYLKYLAAGGLAYSNACRPAPERAIEVINSSGGFASVAHPGRVEMSSDSFIKLIAKLKDCGLGGIEAVYSTHTVIETAYYKEMARTFGLLVTGGSDTHSKDGRNKIGSPEFYPDESLCLKLGL